MMKLYYATGTCALASHIALEEAGAEYSTVKISFATNEQRSPEYLAINPKGRVPSLVTDRGILTETPAMLAYIAQSFPKARAGADRRSLRLCRSAGLQQLSVLDGAYQPRSPPARQSLGRRSSRARSDEKEGAGNHGRLLRPDREQNDEGPMGDGRQLYDLRPLSVHDRRVAGRRQRRSCAFSEGQGAPGPHVGAGRRPKGACGRKRLIYSPT